MRVNETGCRPPDCFLQQPLYLSNKRDSLKYLTQPSGEDQTLIGPVALYLHAAIDQTDTNWIAKLSIIDSGGAESFLGYGYLKASHREMDPQKSKPYQPWHPHARSELVKPGEIYQYAIELDPIACVIKAGARLQLTIKSMESPNDPEMVLHWHPHLCSSKTTMHKIYRNEKHQSHLLLPVIPKRQ